MEDYLLPCMFKKFFGIDSIGCGIQRSILLLFDGEFVAAFKMFPAIYSTVLYYTILYCTVLCYAALLRSTILYCT
jgi:hypothetical protein